MPAGAENHHEKYSRSRDFQWGSLPCCLKCPVYSQNVDCNDYKTPHIKQHKSVTSERLEINKRALNPPQLERISRSKHRMGIQAEPSWFLLLGKGSLELMKIWTTGVPKLEKTQKHVERHLEIRKRLPGSRHWSAHVVMENNQGQRKSYLKWLEGMVPSSLTGPETVPVAASQ